MKYDAELAAKVLDLLAQSGSLRRVCRELGVSRNSIIPWVVDNTEGFGDAYARAKEHGIDTLVEETLDIADDGSNDYMAAKDGMQLDTEHIQRSKIRVETRRWLAERMAPRRYGLKQGVDVTNSDGTLAPVDETAKAARVAQLLAMAQQRKDDADSFGDLA